jgi:hypothetical protein
MTILPLPEPGVKVTKKPSEEAHWSAPKLLTKVDKVGDRGIPKEVTTSTPTGHTI